MNPQKQGLNERDMEQRCSLLKSNGVSTATMAAAACQIKILAECTSMFSHEAQLEYNQLHSEPLHIISLNICPTPPRCSETKGTIWLMIPSHSPESLNASASAALFRSRSDLNLHVNHLMLTGRIGADVNLCYCAIASALIKMSMPWKFETLCWHQRKREGNAYWHLSTSESLMVAMPLCDVL